MKTLCFLFFLLISTNCYSQIFDWAITYPGNHSDRVESLSIDDSGFVYMAGYVNGGPGDGDIIIAKYNSEGDNIWSTEFSSWNNNDRANNIVAMNDHIIVTGLFNDIIIFGEDTLIAEDYLADVFVIKLNSNGVPIWAKSLNGQDYDVGHSVTMDDSSNIYVTGHFESVLSLDTFQVNSCSNYYDIFLAKFDSLGNTKWLKSFGSNKYDISYSIIAYQEKLYMTGYIGGTACFDSDTLYNTDGNDVFLAVFDNNGTTLWARNSYGEDDFNDGKGNDLALDKNGNIIAVGRFQGTLQFGNHTITSPGFGSFAVKYDIFGNCLWAKSIGGLGCDGIAIDDKEKIFVTGFYWGNATIDTITLNNYGASDVYIAKFDSSMNVIWATHGGGHSSDYPSDIIVNEQNEVYISGDYSGYIGYALFGSFSLPTNNSRNIFIAKISDILTNFNVQYKSPKSLPLFYPNPVENIIYCENHDQVRQLKIYDVSKKIVLYQNKIERHISISHLNRGIYFFELTTKDNESILTKIIIR